MKKVTLCLLIAALSLSLDIYRAYAQIPEPNVAQPPLATTRAVNPPPTPQNSGTLPISDSTGPQIVHFMSDLEFWLSVLIVLFGVFVVILEYRLLSRAHAEPADVMRVLAVTLILVGSLFLITAGYSNNQISPVSGLFGTIAGYLLGRANPSDAKRKRNKSKAPEKVEGEA